jgi:hypothetical protein
MRQLALPLRIGSCCSIFLAGLVVAIALPIERGASQTAATTSTEAEPSPAPDPVPDPNPNPPIAGDGSSSDSSGSSGGSDNANPSPGTDGTESTTASTDRREPRTKPEPKRPKQHADRLDQQATAAHEPRDPASRPASQAGNAIGLGLVARPKASTLDHLELFVLGLAGALALALMLLAALPPRVLAGVSVALSERSRGAEIIIAAVLWSLVIGLLAARCSAQLG